jgi:hypothetical protein
MEGNTQGQHQQKKKEGSCTGMANEFRGVKMEGNTQGQHQQKKKEGSRTGMANESLSGAAKTVLVFLLLCLAPVAAMLRIVGCVSHRSPSGGSGSSFYPLLSHRAEPGVAALTGALFALEGAARTFGGCAAQSAPSTGFGTVKAAQKISSTEGGLNASGVSLEDDDRFGFSVASVGDLDGAR